MRYIKFFEAINESLEQSMRKDPKIILKDVNLKLLNSKLDLILESEGWIK